MTDPDMVPKLVSCKELHPVVETDPEPGTIPRVAPYPVLPRSSASPMKPRIVSTEEE